jgi:transcriptional regulator with XRE-family HTH domain
MASKMVQKIRQIQLVGHKIRQLRKQRRLTQTELAGKIGIQQSDLSRMEKGEYRVSLDTLFRILGEFDMGIGEFFDEMAQESFTPRDVSLVRQFNNLPPESQNEVQEFISFKRAQRTLEVPEPRAATPKHAANQGRER